MTIQLKSKEIIETNGFISFHKFGPKQLVSIWNSKTGKLVLIEPNKIDRIIP